MSRESEEDMAPDREKQQERDTRVRMLVRAAV